VRQPVGWHVLVVVIIARIVHRLVTRLVEQGRRKRTTRPSGTGESGPNERSDPATTSRHDEFPIVSVPLRVHDSLLPTVQST